VAVYLLRGRPRRTLRALRKSGRGCPAPRLKSRRGPPCRPRDSAHARPRVCRVSCVVYRVSCVVCRVSCVLRESPDPLY
jgi:hypothetical protein